MALNKEQKLAVDSNSKNIVCIAGAGTGKTFTMISRISRLVSEGVNPSKILVLTFTNAAAAEMKERYRNSHKGERIPMFCTFHSFCYSLIVRDKSLRSKLGYTDVPTIPSEEDIRKIFNTCISMCGTKLSLEQLHGDKPLSPSEKFQYDVFWKQYYKLLKKNNFITFDIMCNKVCKLFSENDPCTDNYKHHYEYLFVDEFQDTDPTQWKFVSSFKNSNIFIVGDAKQAIYAFRNADSSIIKQLAQSDDWQTIKLSHNYRSTKQICDFANRIHAQWKDEPYNLDIVSDKSGEGVSVLIDEEFDEYDEITLRNMVLDKSTDQSLAILCRTNNEVKQLIDMLRLMNVEFTTKTPSKYASDILKSVSDSQYMITWLSNKLTSKQYNEYLKLCLVDSKYETEVSFRQLYSDRLSRYFKTIDDVRSVIEDESLFCLEKCSKIAKMLKLNPGALASVGDNDSDILSYLIEISDKTDSSSNIYVGTIHSVKGLEYDVVHLLGVGSDTFKLINEDNLNLYYVGATRAKEKLYVHMC